MKRALRLPLTLAALLLAISSLALGQENTTVKWKLLTPSVTARPGETASIRVEASIDPGYHLYSLKTYPPDAESSPMPTEITVTGSPSMKLGSGIRTSKKPTKHLDPNFEIETEFWDKQVVFTVPVKIAKSAKAGEKLDGSVNFNFMTCNDERCIPSTDKAFTFSVEIAKDSSTAADTTAARDTVAAVTADTASAPSDSSFAADAPVTPADSTLAASAPSGTNTADDDEELTGSNEQIAAAQAQGLGSYIGLAALMGALALLTPCVFPMIPITISFFTKRTQSTRRRSLRDAGLYSLGIILSFTMIGFLFALLLGASGIQDFATNPIVNIAIATVFMILALNLFGMFEIQLPTSVLNRLNRKAQSDGDSITGVLLMGVVFSLTSFTCTVPFVGGLMVSATTTGNWLWPLLGMATFATVFAAPFFLLALFPAVMKSLPRSGGWLNSVKVVMGFLELAAAIKFLSNADLVWAWGLLTREFFLSIWIAIAVLITIYLLGRFTLPHDSPVDKVGPIRVLFAVGSLAVAFWLIIGVFGGSLGELEAMVPPQEYPGKGNTSPLASIGGGGAGAARIVTTGGSERSTSDETWMTDRYSEALALAKQTGKPLFVDFTGFTCTNCRWMEKNMFPKKEISELMSRYILVRLYTDGRDSIHKVNRKMQVDRFRTIALPYYAIISPADSVLGTFDGMTRKEEKFASFLRSGVETTLALR
jgi:thiol:disulfide interchange protein